MAKSATSSKAGAGRGKKAKEAAPAAPPKTDWIALKHLHFDSDNPRFASEGKSGTDSELLDEIVKRFGIDDVLSSIAVNGYMDSEPLVGIELPNNGGVCVKEGNRRLAALLILADDPRAKDHANLRVVHPLADGVHIDPVPVVLYKEGAELRQLLPYLGVRHIIGSRPWDSYAKAAWVARMLETHGDAITLEKIEEMTGDTRGTIARLLEGYYLVRQLIETDRFVPNESYPKGRGSAVEYPFSWVYNALGWKNVKDWLGMTQDSIGPNPVPAENLDRASELMVFMFGRKSSKTRAAIVESRELGNLAKCLGDEKMVAQLRNQKTVKEVVWSSKTGFDRVLQSVAKADGAISDALGSVDELAVDEADRVEQQVKIVRNKAKSLYDKVMQKKGSDE